MDKLAVHVGGHQGSGNDLLHADVYIRRTGRIEEEEEMIERLLDWEEEEDEEKKNKVEKEHERSERGGWEAGPLRHFYLVVDAHNRVVSDNIPLLEHPDKLMGELMAWPPRKGEYRYFTVDNYDDTEIELIFAGRQIYEDGKYRGTIYVGADVTAQKAVLRQLMFVLIGLSAFFVLVSALLGYVMSGRAMKPIADSFERQRRFISDASHELRTPLSIIHASLEVLDSEERDNLGPFSRQILDDLKDETRRMSSLVTQLLSIAQGDSSEIRLNMEEFLLRDEMMKVIRQVQPLAQEKELFLETDIQTDLLVYADKDRLRQLLLILLDNALQYTPKGGGGITVTAVPEGRDVKLMVQDTGIGIPKEQHEEIFERFFRADPSRNRGTGQVGLGLSIAKWIAEAHGGRIFVQSSPGEGSTFTVRLPILRACK